MLFTLWWGKNCCQQVITSQSGMWMQAFGSVLPNRSVLNFMVECLDLCYRITKLCKMLLAHFALLKSPIREGNTLVLWQKFQLLRFWNTLTNDVLLNVLFSLYSGYLYITIKISILKRTPAFQFLFMYSIVFINKGRLKTMWRLGADTCAWIDLLGKDLEEPNRNDRDKVLQ